MPSTPSFQSEPEDSRPRAFPYPIPMDPTTKSLSNIPQAMFYPALVAFIGGSAFAGSLVPKVLPVPDETKDIASVGAAVVLGAGAAYASVQAKKKRDSGAVIDLYNAIVDLPDPSQLSADIVSGVGSKYGMNMQKDDLDGLTRLYGQYLENIIPTGDMQLRGDEAEKVRSFKDALGLADEDAAPAHLDVARRLYRQGFETKDRAQQFEQRKAFQRLVYLSSLVFGDAKSAFLLPWRRHFTLTEAQLFVARRDNAKTIFKSMFEAAGGHLQADRQFLKELRDKAVSLKVMDESCAEVVREYSRRHCEARLTRALEAIKATGRNKDVAVMVEEVAAVLQYSRSLAGMAGDEELVPGLAAVTVTGGPLAAEGKVRELKDLFRAYLDERMEQLGEFSAALDDDARDLQGILGLGAKDAASIRDEVAAKLYRRLLREEVTSKRIDAAADPQTVLAALAARVRFSPEAATELHKQLYRAKMASLVEKGKLTEGDRADLVRIRRILCLPEELALKVDRETCGKVLDSVIGDIFMAGAKPVPEVEMARVQAVVQDLAIEAETAVAVLAAAARDRMKSYVTAAQKDRGDARESVAHLKKMVQFNQAVVTPMLERLRGVDSLRAEPGSDSDEVEERRGQKEINLREDVDARTRAQVYNDYMMYSVTGDAVELPVGGMFRKKTNSSSRQAEQSRLAQLADVLGMTEAEVAQCQKDMAEHSFKAQVVDVMRTGPMTKERSQYLEELRIKLGVSKELGDKVVKAAKSEVYGSAAAAMDEGGRWTLERVLDVYKAGGSIEDMVDEVTRRNIYRKEIERSITDGSGELNANFILKKLPFEVLCLNENKVRLIIKELVASRKRMLLVQAVSQHRQKRPDETVVSLQNLLSCVRALPEKEPMQWSEKAELRDVFQIYCSEESNSSKREEVRTILGLSESEASELGAASDSEEGPVKIKNEEDSFF